MLLTLPIRASLLFLAALVPSLACAQDLTFSRACEPGDTLTIAAVGDVLLHAPLQQQAYGPAGFASLWQETEPLLAQADLAYANFEGPAAYSLGYGGRQVTDPGLHYDNNAYTSYPVFNYHPLLISELRRAGFALVSTANNHAMDRGPIGADKTIEAMRSANMTFMGTRTQAEAADENHPWHTLTRKNGWNIAWLACSFSTNGMPDPRRQVLMCFRDADTIERQIRVLHADPSIDAVIVTPHWGEVEYTSHIEPSQRSLAHRFADAGALAILGNHPHVTKPMEKIITSDGRESFVIYSIGNFVSAQGSTPKRTSPMVFLGLTKAPGQKAWINGVTYTPLYMLNAPWSVVPVDANARASREATTLLDSLLGHERRIDARSPVRTNIECRN